jgi:anti-sigma B factor antagonist
LEIGIVETNVKQQDLATILSVTGSVDALTAGDLTNVMLDNLKGKHNNLVVDLGGVEFMSSAGLRAIMIGLKESRQHGGDLRLADAQPGVEKILKMSGFTNILKTFPSVEEAISSFGS